MGGGSGDHLREKQDSDTTQHVLASVSRESSRVEPSRCEDCDGRDKEPLRLTTHVSEFDEKTPFVTGTASSKQLRATTIRLVLTHSWSSVPKRRRYKRFCVCSSPGNIFFSYTLLPLPGKTTRPGVLDRNYDLDARCVCLLETPGRATNHHAPCSITPMLHCPCQQPMHEGLGRRLQACPQQVRASSLGCAHLLQNPRAVLLFTVKYCALPYHKTPLPCLGVDSSRNVAMPSADCLGKECEMRRRVRTNRLRRVGYLLYLERPAEVRFCHMDVGNGFDDASAYVAPVAPDLPRLMAFLHFPSLRAGRALTELAAEKVPC